MHQVGVLASLLDERYEASGRSAPMNEIDKEL